MGFIHSYRLFFLMSLFSILGSFIFYQFSISNFLLGGYGILFSFVMYSIYSYIIYSHNIVKSKQEILIETITLFSIFLFPLLAYGFVVLDGIYGALFILVLFAFLQLFNFVRNWSDGVNHSKGFPLILHGLLFPFVLFNIEYFNLNFQEGIMVSYFILTSMLSISSYNFIRYQGGLFESNNEEESDEDIINSIPTIGSKSHKSTSIKEENNDNETSLKEQGKSKNKGVHFFKLLPPISREYDIDLTAKDEEDENNNSDGLEQNEKNLVHTNKAEDGDNSELEENLDAEDEKFFNSLNKL